MSGKVSVLYPKPPSWLKANGKKIWYELLNHGVRGRNADGERLLQENNFSMFAEYCHATSEALRFQKRLDRVGSITRDGKLRPECYFNWEFWDRSRQLASLLSMVPVVRRGDYTPTACYVSLSMKRPSEEYSRDDYFRHYQ